MSSPLPSAFFAFSLPLLTLLASGFLASLSEAFLDFEFLSALDASTDSTLGWGALSASFFISAGSSLTFDSSGFSDGWALSLASFDFTSSFGASALPSSATSACFWSSAAGSVCLASSCAAASCSSLAAFSASSDFSSFFTSSSTSGCLTSSSTSGFFSSSSFTSDCLESSAGAWSIKIHDYTIFGEFTYFVIVSHFGLYYSLL